MKPGENPILQNVPREVNVMNDDNYLVEITDRLRRMRSLLAGQQEQQPEGAS